MKYPEPFKGPAIDLNDLDNLNYPLLMSAKIDGYRFRVVDGVPITSSGNVLANKHVAEMFKDSSLNNLDGELVVGPMNAHDVYKKTSTLLKAHNRVPTEKVTWCIFDDFTDPSMNAVDRLFSARNRIKTLKRDDLHLVDQFVIHDPEQARKCIQTFLDQGYEGAMLKAMHGQYLFKKASFTEAFLFKIKPYTDAEAVIIGFKEEMENTNEKIVSPDGKSKRSSKAAGKVGKGTLGAFICRDLLTGFEFTVSGIDDKTKKRVWENQTKYLNQIITYSYLALGTEGAPRQPQFKCFRSPDDMVSL